MVEDDAWPQGPVHIPMPREMKNIRVGYYIRPEGDIARPVSVREFLDMLLDILSEVLQDPRPMDGRTDLRGWSFLCDAAPEPQEETPIRLSLRKEDGDGVLIVPLFSLPPSILCPPRERETKEVAYYRLLWVFRLARHTAGFFFRHRYGRADRLLATDTAVLGTQIYFLLAQCGKDALVGGYCYWLKRHHAWTDVDDGSYKWEIDGRGAGLVSPMKLTAGLNDFDWIFRCSSNAGFPFPSEELYDLPRPDRSQEWRRACLSPVSFKEILDWEWMNYSLGISPRALPDGQRIMFFRPEWVLRRFLLDYFGLRSHETGDLEKEDHGPVVADIVSTQHTSFRLVLTRGVWPYPKHRRELQKFVWHLDEKMACESDDDPACWKRRTWGSIDISVDRDIPYCLPLFSASGLIQLAGCLRSAHIHTGFNVCG